MTRRHGCFVHTDFIPGHCGDINALIITKRVEAEHVRLLVPEDEAATTIHPEGDKPVVVTLPELHVCIVLQRLLHKEPLRHLTPPIRLEREDEHVRVVEELVLLRRGKGVEHQKPSPSVLNTMTAMFSLPIPSSDSASHVNSSTRLSLTTVPLAFTSPTSER